MPEFDLDAMQVLSGNAGGSNCVDCDDCFACDCDCHDCVAPD